MWLLKPKSTEVKGIPMYMSGKPVWHSCCNVGDIVILVSLKVTWLFIIHEQCEWYATHTLLMDLSPTLQPDT